MKLHFKLQGKNYIWPINRVEFKSSEIMVEIKKDKSNNNFLPHTLDEYNQKSNLGKILYEKTQDLIGRDIILLNIPNTIWIRGLLMITE